MTVGKNKKKGKKGVKKRLVDPYTKKEWYEINAPNVFSNKHVGYTLVNKTAGAKIASDSLKGRVFETNLADLQKDEDQGFRNVRLRCEDINGSKLLTQFHGMDFTTDKLRSLVRKWHTLIEAHCDVKTLDGYVLRMFAIGLTKRRPNQIRRTSYATSAQIRQIRAKMIEIMTREATTCDLKDLVGKFIPEAIGKVIEKETQGIYPLNNVYIRKVKMLKTPKHDLYKLMELYADTGATGAEDAGKKISATEVSSADKSGVPATESIVGE